MHSNDIELETFGYVLPHFFETKFLKIMICEDLRWGRCDIKSTSLLGNVLSMNRLKRKVVMRLLCTMIISLLRQEHQIYSL